MLVHRRAFALLGVTAATAAAAVTDDLTASQDVPGPDLVTITIGGNDLGPSAITGDCAAASPTGPVLAPGVHLVPGRRHLARGQAHRPRPRRPPRERDGGGAGRDRAAGDRPRRFPRRRLPQLDRPLGELAGDHPLGGAGAPGAPRHAGSRTSAPPVAAPPAPPAGPTLTAQPREPVALANTGPVALIPIGVVAGLLLAAGPTVVLVGRRR